MGSHLRCGIDPRCFSKKKGVAAKKNCKDIQKHDSGHDLHHFPTPKEFGYSKLFPLSQVISGGTPAPPTARAAQRLPSESNDRALLQTRDTTLQSRPPADGKIAHQGYLIRPNPRIRSYITNHKLRQIS